MRTALLLAAAIMLASGATAGAAKLITSSDIRNGTIRTVDMSSSAKRALKGARGEPGPQGPAGPVALGKLTRVVATGTFLPGDINHVTVLCPAGYGIVSGGFAVIGGNTTAFYSDSFGSPNSWSVGVDNFESSLTATADAIAFCAPAGQAVVSGRQGAAEARADRVDSQRRRAY